MAERVVSPGVFTRERDLSFLPQGIGEIGAAIIGPTKIGSIATVPKVGAKTSSTIGPTIGRKLSCSILPAGSFSSESEPRKGDADFGPSLNRT